MADLITTIIVAPTHVINAMIDDDGLISFSKIKPWGGDESVPATSETLFLVDSESPLVNFPQGITKDNTESLSLIARAVQNIAQTGYATWYDHHLDQWGTKSDACDQEIEIGDEYSRVKFTTAWCQPTGLLKSLSEMFPDDVIKVYYGGVHHCGLNTYHNGDELSSELISVNGRLCYQP